MKDDRAHNRWQRAAWLFSEGRQCREGTKFPTSCGVTRDGPHSGQPWKWSPPGSFAQHGDQGNLWMAADGGGKSPPFGKPPDDFAEHDVSELSDVDCDIGQRMDTSFSVELEAAWPTADEILDIYYSPMDNVRSHICQKQGSEVNI